MEFLIECDVDLSVKGKFHIDNNIAELPSLRSALRLDRDNEVGNGIEILGKYGAPE